MPNFLKILMKISSFLEKRPETLLFFLILQLPKDNVISKEFYMKNNFNFCFLLYIVIFSSLIISISCIS